MTDGKGCKHGVILSGGGASGAYEVGVLKGLFAGDSPATDYTPLMPDVFAGTSIGAYNASLLVAEIGKRGFGAIDHLEDIWLNVLPQDDSTGHNFVARYRGDPFEYLNPNFVVSHPFVDSFQLAGDLAFFAKDFYRRGLVFFLSSDDIETRVLKLMDLSSIISNEPERRLIEKTINFQNIRQSDKVLRIATTNWSTGALRVFGNDDLTDDLGPRAVLASTSIPGIFPQIEIQDEYYADGGIVMNTPMNLAIDAGANILHVVYLDPEVKAIPLLPVRNSIDTFSRFFAIQFAATVNRDIEVTQQINEGLAIVERATKGGPVSGKDVRPFVLAAKRLSNLKDYSKYRKITVHRYQPMDALRAMSGLLNFNRNKGLDLIERGFQEAVFHDCKKSRCVLAGG